MRKQMEPRSSDKMEAWMAIEQKRMDATIRYDIYNQIANTQHSIR